MQFIGLINQQRCAIVALEAIISALPGAASVDRDQVKQNVKDSRVFGPLSPEFAAECEAAALRILG